MRPAGLPPGPPYPSALQAVGFWARPFAFLRQCRERYGKRFTIKLPVAPPFVMLTDPAEVKEVFTAPPDVLRPGEGARVLEPVVGTNSVILLDEGAHMEQRKLMLPAFHGERMERLAGLMEEVTVEELGALPRDMPVELHPRMQDLTLKIILRAVFGLDPGARFEALRQRLQEMLEFGDRPISLMPPPKDSAVARVVERIGPFATFLRIQAEVDELLFELIAERRREGASAERDDVLAMLLEARHEDGSPMTRAGDPRRADDAARRRPRDDRLTLAWAFERLPREPRVLAQLVEEVDERRRRLPHGDDPGDPAPPAGAAERRPAARRQAGRGRRLDLPGRMQPRPQRLPDPPRPGDLPRTRTPSAPSASSTSRRAPTPGSPSAAAAAAASAPASRCSR